MRTDLANILKFIVLVLEMAIIQHMLNFFVKSTDQNLEVFTQDDLLFFNDVKDALSEVL